MKLEKRIAIAEMLATLPEFAGNAHPYKPDAMVPPVAYVDTLHNTPDGPTMRTVSMEGTVVLVADGQSMAARQRLDSASDALWVALKRVGCTPQSETDETLGDLPTPPYPALRVHFVTLSECL